jgi:hypothetical protein
MVVAMVIAARLRAGYRRQNCAANDEKRDHEKQTAGKLFQWKLPGAKCPLPV